MFTKIKKLFSLFQPNQRRQLIMLQLLVMIMAGFELIGIASVGPFMLLVSDTTIIESNLLLAKAYALSGLTNYNDFILYAGLLVIIILAIGTSVSIYTTWVLSQFGQKLGVSIADRLFEFYLHRPWLYHASVNSASLTKTIAAETGRIKSGIIDPLMRLNAKFFIAIFIATSLLIYDPYVAITALIIFMASYLLIYKLVKLKLAINSKKVSSSYEDRYMMMSEGFGGIKDILLLRCQESYTNEFNKSGDILARNTGTVVALAQMPRFFMEFIAFSSIIIFLLVLLRTYDGDMASIIPILTVYTLAGFKLLPAFQQVYSSIAQIQGNMSAFDYIKQDLEDSQKLIKKDIPERKSMNADFSINESIILKDIYFTYPNKNTPALQELNLEIPANRTIGLVGPSGSGKSTIVDLLLGLILPNKGNILVDGKALTVENLPEWQDNIGYVPQSIFLSDATILENIAFGNSGSEIDIERANHSINLSHLSELIDGLPKGLNSSVGENGVQLSGGQRQRIGIARALYRDAKILVLDEATSSLDSIAEKKVMNAIYEHSGTRTIILVAHRLTTVEACDILYLIDKGRVVDSGSYQYLVDNNPEFLKLANIIK